jgi:hypothetical protein
VDVPKGCRLLHFSVAVVKKSYLQRTAAQYSLHCKNGDTYQAFAHSCYDNDFTYTGWMIIVTLRRTLKRERQSYMPPDIPEID